MNFEELEENTAIHVLRHYTGTPLNQDYSCFVCYPIPTEEATSSSFKNFWLWFKQEFRADTFSAYTIVSFDLFKNFILAPASKHHTIQLPKVINRLLSSIRFIRRPFSSEVLFLYTQGLAARTNCFQTPVDLSTSEAVFQELLDQELLSIQRDRELIRQILASPTPSVNSLHNTPPVRNSPSPTSPPANMGASAAELTALFQNIFGTDGANLTAIANAPGNAERNTVKIETFGGTEGEDPVEWLKAFNRAAITNRWNTQARKNAVAGAYMKGAAADWYEGITATIGDHFNMGANGGNNFTDLFNNR